MNKIFLGMGLLCFLVPFLLRIVDDKEQEHILETYETELKQVETDVIDEAKENAKQYNQMLFELQSVVGGNEMEGAVMNVEYEEQMNLLGNGMIGNIQIPVIDLKLPIYHGTSEEVLSNGIGHLEGSSIPVGGKNTHAVLTGHRALPSAELFTRLDEVGEEDLFFVNIGRETLVYEVIRIQVVRPEEIAMVDIIEGKDLISLVTCTPYGINTHRLVVTGERLEKEAEVIENLVEQEEEKQQEFPWMVLFVVGISAILVMTARRRRE